MNIEVLLNSPVTIALLIANVVLSVIGFQNPRLIDQTIFDMRRVRHGRQYFRLITSGFIHGDPFHLFVNMLTLFFLGPALESAIGSLAFAGIYFASLLAGALWMMLENYRNLGYRALGASGAISGVVTAFAIFAPFVMFYLFFAVPIPAIVFAVLYIAWSAWAQGRVQDGIGHAAHLGGALMGVVIVCVFWPEAPRGLWRQIVDFMQGF
jgi:membrane associated rhomboid family serine protease